MERISVADAQRQFDDLVGRVTNDGVVVELERDDEVVARFAPAKRAVRVADLNNIFSQFPSLNEDADKFADDLAQIRREAEHVG